MDPWSLEIHEVEAKAVVPLRTAVLRPGLQGKEQARWEGDEEAAHFAARRADRLGGGMQEILGVVSYYPRRPGEEEVQLRGMAVAEEVRGQGVGSRLLAASLVRVSLKWPELKRVWCNARERAVSLYEREGFVVVSEPFEVEGIGVHLRMERSLPRVMA